MSRCLCFALALFLVAAGTVHATRLVVPGAYETIADGLAAASPGDTVWIACGTYFEHDLRISSGVALVSETGDPACVTIDAQGLGRVLEIRNAEDIFIHGLTISGGLAPVGGGLYTVRSQYTVRRCRFTGNAGVGSAVNDSRSEVLLEFCLIDSNNDPSWPSGTVYCEDDDAVVRNCTLANNAGPGGYFRNRFFMNRDPRLLLERTIYGFSQGVGEVTVDCSYTGNPQYCDPENADFRLQASSPCLPGGICEDLVGALPPCAPSPPVSVHLSTSDPEAPLVVDGVPVFGPATFDWEPLSLHVVAAPDTFEATGTRFVFESWSDDDTAPADRLYLVPPAGADLVAHSRRQYALTLSAVKNGSVGSVARWHPEGDVVQIVADPDSGFAFDDWAGTGPGSYTGTNRVAEVTMEGPVEETASFNPLRFAFTVSASDTDPWQTIAPPVGAVRYLHLWLVCANGGLAAVEMFADGSLTPTVFVPVNGVLNIGSPGHLLLAVPGCPTGDEAFRLGFWVVEDDGGTFCPNMFTTATSIAGAVDCHLVHAAATEDAYITGFASDGSQPCTLGQPGCLDAPFEGGPVAAPADFSIAQLSINPNPFQGTARLTLGLPRGAVASLVVFDVAGRRVRTLLEDRSLVGNDRVVWNGRDDAGRVLPAGVFFVRLDSPTGHATRKVTYLGLE